MNPAQFSNPGGGMPGLVKPGMSQQQQQQQRNENAQMIMSSVAQELQMQPRLGGWKADIPIKVRAMNVYQMITSLRLIQPRIDLKSAGNAAIAFETAAFKRATDRSEYEKECTEKLHHIKDTRQRQANVVQQSGMMPQGGPAMQNQLQGVFAPQMNSTMQNSSVGTGQPQMAMGMNNLNQQVAMQQRQQQQQQQQVMLQQQQQQQQLQQRTQQRPANGMPLTDDIPVLQPPEADHVVRLAEQMMAKTTPEELEKLKMNLNTMSQEQRQYLQAKGLDPITYFFRTRALDHMRRFRRARMDMGRAANPANGEAVLTGDPMMNQQAMFQNMMNLQRSNTTFSGNPAPGQDPNAFFGNVENIQGQQADGLRSQEAGQLVVPASSSQINPAPFNNQPNLFTQQAGQNGQGNGAMNGMGMNAQLFNQQHMQQGLPNGAQQFHRIPFELRS